MTVIVNATLGVLLAANAAGLLDREPALIAVQQLTSAGIFLGPHLLQKNVRCLPVEP